MQVSLVQGLQPLRSVDDIDPEFLLIQDGTTNINPLVPDELDVCAGNSRARVQPDKEETEDGRGAIDVGESQ